MIKLRHETKNENPEKNLTNSEQRFHSLVENAAVAIGVTDLRGRLTYVNKACADLWSYSTEELLGRPFKDFLHPDDRGKVFRLFLKIIALRREPEYFEFRGVRKDGQIIHLASKPTTLAINGKTVGFQAIIVDVTELKKTERKLEEINKKLQALFDAATEGIATTDTNENFTFVNKAFANMLGYKENDLLGMNVRKLVNKEDFQKIREETESRKKGKISQYEISMYRKDGKPRIIQVSAAPLWDEQRNYAGTIGIVTDITETRRVQEALRESEERFRAISTSAKDAIILIDSDGKISYWNPAAERIFGYKSEEIIGREFHNSFLTENIRELYEKGFQYFRETGAGPLVGKTLEAQFIRKDRKEVPVELSISALKMKGKWHALGILRDISERKKAEEAVRASQERLNNIFTASPDAITVSDLYGNIIECNQATLNMHGFLSKEEVIGRNALEFIAKKDHQRAIESLKKTLKQGLARNIEYTFLTKDGREFPAELSASVLKDYTGKPAGFVAITKDITERKQAEQAIRESQQKFERLFMSNPEAAVYWDSDFRILDVNPRFSELFGYSLDEIRGKKPSDVIVPKDKIEESDTLGKKAKEGYVNYDTIRKRKDGSLVPVSVSTSPIVVEGQLIGYVGLYKDITERKQMQKKLEEYSQQLEEKVEERTKQLKEAHERLVKSERLAAIGELASMVGHDLRNPLTGIAGATYYLRKKLEPTMDEKIEEMLDLIEKDIEHSNKIIIDLLEYSREIKLELTEIDPKTIIEEVLFLVCAHKNIQVVNSTTRETKIKIDAEKMKRVFINIVKNAFDAMPNGGKLTISSKEKNGNLEIVFSDTGTGMSKEVIAKIWTPFFTTKAKGMGLGLAICKRIVEAHGGGISVESTVDEGTTFIVTIPIAPKIKRGEKIWVNMPESLLSTTTTTKA